MLIRYPGSKRKLVEGIVRHFPDEMLLDLRSAIAAWEYREPFFGAGAIGFDILARLSPRCEVWLNDKDYWLVCLWTAVHDAPDELRKLVLDFTPSVEKFEDFKRRDGQTDADPLVNGFQKLALHQMSYSGLGCKSGGPLGGKSQKNERYNVACRWNPARVASHIVRCHAILKRFKRCRITCRDFSELTAGCHSRAFCYLDPPYYEKGPQLYRHSMTRDDHARLAGSLRQAKYRWALSYDDHPEIRRLYSWAQFHELSTTYTAARSKEQRRPKNKEIVILPAA